MNEHARPSHVSPPAARRPLVLAAAGVAALLAGPLLPGFGLGTGFGVASAQALPGEAGPQADLPEPMLRLMEDYYHFATVGQYPVANALGQQLLDGGYTPEQFLDGFREVNKRLNTGTDAADVLDRRLLEWQKTPEIADVSKQVNDKINDGRRERATNPAFVAEQVERLSRGAAAYSNALANLRNSGEYAVPTDGELPSRPREEAVPRRHPPGAARHGPAGHQPAAGGDADGRRAGAVVDPADPGRFAVQRLNAVPAGAA